jgi:hypothetical protein
MKYISVLQAKRGEGILVKLPALVGTKVYKICPRCLYTKDEGTCENCAWRYCSKPHGCTVWEGSSDKLGKHVVEQIVTWDNMGWVEKELGHRLFLTKQEAIEVLKEACD